MRQRENDAGHVRARKNKQMIFQLPIHGHTLGAALARIALVFALLAAPMLALAGNNSTNGNFVGTEIQRSNGAGLVIMFGLQRAR